MSTSLTVAPGLPLLRAVLRRASTALNNAAGAAGAVLAAVPSDEELAGVQSVPAATALVAASSSAVENRGDKSAPGVSPSSAPGVSPSSAPGVSPSSAASVVDVRSPSPGVSGPSAPPVIKPPSTSLGIGGVGSAASRGPMTVWHGQRGTLELHLTNVGSTAVSSITQLIVTNARGQALKPLPRDVGRGGGGSGVHPQGRLPSSASGIHLEPSEGALAALAAAMPLAPGASVMVSVDLNVGRPPFGDPFEEVVLEVCVAYVGAAGPRAIPPVVVSSTLQVASGAELDIRGSATSNTSASPLQEDITHATGPDSNITRSQMLGRRLSLPVRFKIQPTVQVLGDIHLSVPDYPTNSERSLPHRLDLIIC